MCSLSQLTVAVQGSYLSGFVELLLEPRYGHDGCSCALVPDRDDDLDAAGQRWRRDRGPNWCVTMMTSSHTSLHVLSSLEGSPACVYVCVYVCERGWLELSSGYWMSGTTCPRQR